MNAGVNIIYSIGHVLLQNASRNETDPSIHRRVAEKIMRPTFHPFSPVARYLPHLLTDTAGYLLINWVIDPIQFPEATTQPRLLDTRDRVYIRDACAALHVIRYDA